MDRAFAAEDTAVAVSTGATFELPITKGHHMYDASAFYTGIGTDTQAAGVFVSNEYFLIDHLSLGATIGATWFDSPFSQSSRVVVQIAPSATFYIMPMGAWAPFVAQSVGYSDVSYSRWGGTTSVGVRYFFNPHVAFSPNFRAVYGERTPGSANFNAGFSLFY